IGRSVRQLQDSIRIEAPPQAIWDWLVHLTDHYTEWHPDHVSAVWERGQPNQIGSVMCAVEKIGDKRETLRFEMTFLEPPAKYEYRIKGPHSIVLPGGGFEIRPDAGGSIFTATISYRFGVLVEWILRRRTGSLRDHMREEGENLKQIIEQSA
ncbi:MAG: SRPBCC family protein, partial [Acidimicrobiia bacterium]